MPDASDPAQGMAGPPPVGPAGTCTLPLGQKGFFAARGAAPHPRRAEHSYTPRQGEGSPRHQGSAAAVLQSPPFLLPIPGVSGGPSRAMELPCTLGCPSSPSRLGCHGSTHHGGGWHQHLTHRRR